MKYNIPDRVLKDIITFAQNNNIEKIILYGSRARGTHTMRSDIDLAVFGGMFDSFYQNIKERTHSLLTFDIVEFDNDISDELKKEINRDGVVIYEKT